MKEPNLTTYRPTTIDPLTMSLLVDGSPIGETRIDNGVEWNYSFRLTPDGVIAELSPAPWNLTFAVFEMGDFFYDDCRRIWQRLDGNNALNTQDGEIQQWGDYDNTSGSAPAPAKKNFWAEFTPIYRKVSQDVRVYEFGIGGISAHDDAYYATTGQKLEPTGRNRVTVMTRAGCGCVVPRRQLMSASLGTSCPDCYDRMSD